MEPLKDRILRYSVRVVEFCAALPSNRPTDILARQLLGAGTSPGAHFREALRARSKAEYVAKMNSGLMELEETAYWLEVLAAAPIKLTMPVDWLASETNELTAIFVSQIRKWKPRP